MASRFVGVRLPAELVAKAKLVAQREHRTLSNYLLMLVAQDIEAREEGGGSVQESPVPYGKAQRKAG